MAKKFINPDWKALRKLKSELRQAYFYCWDKSDAIGVYEYDYDYIKTDLGFDIPFEELLKLPNAHSFCSEKLYFSNYISVNYTSLKENYNPHKPAFRELSKHGLRLNSSLNEINSSLMQACGKLEEEEEDKEEDSIVIIPEVFQNFPSEESISLSLPDIKLQGAKQILAGIGHRGISDEQITSLWQGFKMQQFTGKKWYGNEGDIYGHFMNTLKTVKFIPIRQDDAGVSYVPKIPVENNKW